MRAICFNFLIFLPFLLNAQVNPDDVTGKWITEEGKSLVEIYGQNGKYFGKVLWLKDYNKQGEVTLKDTKNPDEKLRSREVQGMVLMSDFTFDGKMWKDGKVYDPESGNTYSGYMKLKNHDILELRGYMGISMLGRTATWVRKK